MFEGETRTFRAVEEAANRIANALLSRGVKPVGAEDTSEPVERSIEQIAEVYEKELSETVPTGPLVIGGFSFGALPAFELARRLIGYGCEVPLLVSFDGFAPGYPSILPLPERIAAHVREFVGRDGPGRYAYLRDRVRSL